MRELTAAFLDAQGGRVAAELSERLGQAESLCLLPIHRTLLGLATEHIRDASPSRLIAGVRGAASGFQGDVQAVISGQVALWAVLHRLLREVEGPYRNLDVIYATLALVGEVIDGLIGALIDFSRSGDASAFAPPGWETLVELGRTHREFRALNRVVRDLLDARDPARMFQVLQKGLLDTFHLRSLVIAAVDHQEAHVEVVCAYPLAAASRDPIGWRFDLSCPDILCDVVRTGRVEVIDGWDPRYHERVVVADGGVVFRQRPRDFNKGQTAFFIPILARDRVIGIVCTGSRQADRQIVLGEIERMRPFLDQVGAALLVVSEVAERKRSEEERVRLSRAVEQAAEAILITDPDGTIIYVNPAFEQVSGYSREEALGQNPRILKSGRQDAAFYRAMWDTLKRGEVWTGRFINRRKDGTLFEEEAVISPIRNGGGRVVNYVAAKRDVTQEAALEEQLRQAQKMEAVGTLAGGVAHDFNNMLTTIIGFAQLALMEDLAPQVRDYISKIPEQGRRAAALASQLLTFSRKGITEKQPMSLAPLVKETVKILERTLPETIAVRLRVSGGVVPVNADPTQMQQVIMNLCVNASHAMPRGGELTVGLENVTLDDAYCRQYAYARPGRHVCLSVQDTGVGMTPEVQARIFEPFFTTKDAGEGTGLGLAVVYGIVKGHEGHINVYSEVGKGSEFKVHLPAMSSGATFAVAPTQEPPTGGAETLLLVEDDPGVLGTGQAMLERLGYTVLTASNGEEALGVYRARRGEIALVVTDMVMPRMGGEELYEALAEVEPGVKVVLMSGYSVKQDLSDLRAKGLRGFVEKPLDFYGLGQAVRRALDAKDSDE